jgi:hypothetical protein
VSSATERAARIVGVALLIVLLVTVAGGLYFAFTFGAADHTQFTLTAEEMARDRIADNATATLSDREAALVTEARRNESAQTAAERLELDGAYVEQNETYYQVEATSGPTVDGERPVLTIERVNTTEGEPRSVDELPEADRRAFIVAYRAWLDRDTDSARGTQSARTQSVRYVYETVPDPADSVFVPKQDVRYIQEGNRTFRVSVRNESVSLDTTRYQLVRVAENESEFIDTLVRNLTGQLNDSEAEPLEDAIRNGTYVSRASQYDAAERPIRPVAAALGTEEPVTYTGERKAARYIRYEGKYYHVTLSGYTTAA